MDLTFEPAPPDISILAEGVQCGFIDAPTLAFAGWRLRLMIAQRVALVSMWPALQRRYEIWRED